MTPVEQGRHCKKCVKTVHDVSNWSDEKIVDSYLENDQSLCIRIPEERLESVPTKPKTWKYYLVASIMTFFLLVKRNLGFAQISETSKEISPNDTTKQYTEIKLTGVVSDSLNAGNPIVGADVVVYKDGKVVMSTYSDNQGKFKMDISDTFSSEDSLLLSIHYLGMKSVSRKFKVRDTIDTEILMTEGHICLKETVILRRRDIMTGTIHAGIMLWPDKTKARQVYKILDDYDTKHIHHDELQRLNLRH